mmetsp:Transcript_9394/g.14518  ORF Transcript_9394/g.14518 Transcript_9394/m.14518 type:complete len:889 (-) Transcript_9394:129-2795(-)
MKLISRLVPLILPLFSGSKGFYLASPNHNRKTTLVTTRLGINDCPEDDGRNNNNKLSRHIYSIKKSITSRFKPFGLGLVTAASVCSLSRTLVPTAHAVMPVMETSYDSADEIATKTVEAQLARKREMERQERKRRAEEIEQTEGLKARIAYEKEYKAAKEQAEQELLEKMEKLRRSLLDQGLHPFLDIEGIRQDMLLRTGVDLSSIQGSDQYSDAKAEQIGLTKQTYSYQKKNQREIIKMIVEDYKKRGIDPLPMFTNIENQAQHAMILNMGAKEAEKKLFKMKESLEKYGQIKPPKEGEISVKQMIEKDPDYERKQEEKLRKILGANNDPKEVAAAAKAAKAEEKARIKSEKLKAKEEAKIAKAKVKEEARMQRKILKEKKQLEKAQSKTETNDAKLSIGKVEFNELSNVNEVEKAAASQDNVYEVTASEPALHDVSLEEFEDDSKYLQKYGRDSVEKSKDSSITFGKVAGLIAVAVGGKYVIDRRSQVNPIDEAERKRQFNLLMGITDDDDDSTKPGISDVVDAIDPLTIETEKDEINESVNGGKLNEVLEGAKELSIPVGSSPAKKRGLGIKSMFAKKRNNRETDLNNLVSPEAKAPEVAKLLAKLLTYGAPGRFPTVSALPGDMPLTEYDQNKAKELLEDAVGESGLSREDGAEVFANVVNCMLIDIVDLASSSLEEKTDVTYNAISIVVDFMNHAASLYDSVAEGIDLSPPVTYGGNLPKAKLEQMFGTYAFESSMKMEDDATSRIDMLRFVFSISEKKSEGILQKAIQKNIMEMAKTEEGREKLQEMTSGMMGDMGMDGLESMMGGDGEPDKEQLKGMLETLKSMKDAGSIPPEELATVREQFKANFGSSIDEVMNEAKSGTEEMEDGDKELLELMKAILED